MRKTITEKWLRKIGACKDGIEWFKSKNTTSMIDILSVIHEKPDYAEWLIPKIGLTKKQSIKIAIYAAEMSLKNYDRPNMQVLVDAIESAKMVLENDSEKNRSAARSVARSAALKDILAYVIEVCK